MDGILTRREVPWDAGGAIWRVLTRTSDSPATAHGSCCDNPQTRQNNHGGESCTIRSD